VNPAGRGTASNIVSTIVGTAPTAAPTGLTRAATTSVSLTWAWIPLADMYTGGAPLGGYRLYMDTGRDDAKRLVYDGSDMPAVTEFTATSLVCGRNYRAQVSAVTRIGEGPRSDTVEFVLAHTPSQPRAARLISSSTGSITISWDIPESTGCAELVFYKVERDTGNGFELLDYVVPPIKTYTDAGPLTPGHLYMYRVSARNSDLSEYGAHSEYITAYAAALPPMVSNIGFVASTQTSITLQWDPPGDSGGAPIDVYRVQVDDGMGGDFLDAAVVTEPYATVGSLHPGRPYRFRVSAETMVGSGPYAPPFQQVVAAVPGPPNAPTVETVLRKGGSAPKGGAPLESSFYKSFAHGSAIRPKSGS